MLSFFPTWVSLRGFTPKLSNSVAIAITVVASVINDFVPRFSNLIEGPGLWLLTLICWREQQRTHQVIRMKGMKGCNAELCVSILILQPLGLMGNERTKGIALPASTSLPIAGAVHHIAFVMLLGKLLVYFIVQAINNALVCSH